MLKEIKQSDYSIALSFTHKIYTYTHVITILELSSGFNVDLLAESRFKGIAHALYKKKNQFSNCFNSVMISQQNGVKRTKEMTVVILLILEVQLAVADMVQILEPLEVGDADATGVGVHVRDDKDLLVLENLVSRWGDGTLAPSEMSLAWMMSALSIVI